MVQEGISKAMCRRCFDRVCKNITELLPREGLLPSQQANGLRGTMLSLASEDTQCPTHPDSATC